MSNDKGFDLEISRVLNAPLALVWKAWIVKENLEEWWCPKPWRAEFTAFDPRPGGAFDTVMRGPNGEEHVYAGSFLEVAPMERIVFTGLLGANWRPLPDDSGMGFAAIVTMKAEGEKTRYSALVRHLSAEGARKHEEMGFHDGWGAAIAQLEEFAASLD